MAMWKLSWGWIGVPKMKFEDLTPNRAKRRRGGLAGAVVQVLEERVLLAANVIVAPAAYEFRDMGFDPVSHEVGIVGYDVSGSTKTATLFELNATQDAFVTQTLVGLGPGTQVFGIASDASRIAGVSKSPGSIDIGEGTTWLRSALNSPVGIGYASGFSNTAVGVGAWKDGVVGSVGGAQAAARWTDATGLIALAEHENGLATAHDVSADGSTQVGFSSHISGGAGYWDLSGFHGLEDPFAVDSLAISIAPSGNYIGGYVVEELPGRGAIYAAVWDSNRNLIPIYDSLGNRFEGGVQDVSDHGYAVGTTSDGRGFIWHPSFDGVHSPFNGAQIFDDWLAATPGGTTLPFASKGVEAIAEDTADGQLLFALSDYEAPGASAFVEVDVAGIAAAGNNAPVTGGAAAASGSEDDGSINGSVPNATDVDGDSLTYSVVGTAPAGVTFRSDGTFRVVPSGADQGLNNGESRVVAFQYLANDGSADSAAAAVCCL